MYTSLYIVYVTKLRSIHRRKNLVPVTSNISSIKVFRRLNKSNILDYMTSNLTFK